jgi:hypothetical protein
VRMRARGHGRGAAPRRQALGAPRRCGAAAACTCRAGRRRRSLCAFFKPRAAGQMAVWTARCDDPTDRSSTRVVRGGDHGARCLPLLEASQLRACARGSRTPERPEPFARTGRTSRRPLGWGRAARV